MNSSFTKELQKSNIKEKLRNIYTERENNKNNNKVSNLIQSLKKNKHYYKKAFPKKKRKTYMNQSHIINLSKNIIILPINIIYYV